MGAKIVEMLNPVEGAQSNQAPRPRQLVRLGVAAAINSPLLDEVADRVFFDTEGFFFNGSKRSRAMHRCVKDQVLGILLNLDAATPNANTISFFRDGQRVSDPQPLPETLVGKALYPCITYKN